MKKETKAEKIAERERLVEENKLLKKRLRRLASFILGIEQHIYMTELYTTAEAEKLLVKNPRHPAGCQDSLTCTGVAEDPCYTLAYWIREVGGQHAKSGSQSSDS